MQEYSLANMFKKWGDLLFVFGIISVVLLMVIPLPSFLLDILLVASISLSILILLISFYSQKPLDFSSFPTMLLFATLLRLTLNIASTRLILLNGGKGEAGAGEVIKAFGYFVVGGNYVVGAIIFIILVIINFVVITKGAGRIAEVGARFTLDSMPGKQLAIDADLNAGLINEADAKARREKLEREADFYGAMDGASKFVRGDAIAGILITVINIVGGFIIGMVQNNMSLAEALKIYTILSVGDGLVSQIPALVISVSAGLIVSKVSKNKSMSDEITEQALHKWRPLIIASTILGILALIPGLPLVPFAAISAMMAIMGFSAKKRSDAIAAEAEGGLSEDASGNASTAQEKIETIPILDVLEVEVGYDLISLVDQRSGGEFPARIIGIRRQFANEMGVLLPPVHIRDNLKLRPAEYRFYLKGAVVGQGELMPHHSLALDPGMTTRRIEGTVTKDPTFGLDALWIADDQREAAIVAGYTVVDLPSVLATHLIEIVRQTLHDIIGRQELAAILDQVKQSHPKVVSDLVPEILSFGTILKVIQNLLRERVSVRDIITILESLAEHGMHTKDPEELTEYVRVALGRTISQQHMANSEGLYVITLARNVEEKIARSVTVRSGSVQLGIDPVTAKTLVEQIGLETKKHLSQNRNPVLLTSQQVRPHLYKLIEKFIPNLAVLSHSEVAGHVPVKHLGMIGEAA